MLMRIGSWDVTPYISPKSYTVNEEEQYESWKDGNYKEHRIYTRPRAEGSFTIALYGQNGMTTSDFLTQWNAAVDNNILTAEIYVQNTATFREAELYFKFKGKFHREMVNGDYCDKLTVEIQER